MILRIEEKEEMTMLIKKTPLTSITPKLNLLREENRKRKNQIKKEQE